MRVHAVRSLRNARTRESIAVGRRAVKDPVAKVREFAVAALEMIDVRGLTDDLVFGVGNFYRDVRRKTWA